VRYQLLVLSKEIVNAAVVYTRNSSLSRCAVSIFPNQKHGTRALFCMAHSQSEPVKATTLYSETFHWHCSKNTSHFLVLVVLPQ
jgi:hypothetical protein